MDDSNNGRARCRAEEAVGPIMDVNRVGIGRRTSNSMQRLRAAVDAGRWAGCRNRVANIAVDANSIRRRRCDEISHWHFEE